MIYTCSHKNYNSNKYRTIAISGNRGKDANYTGEFFKDLAPKLSFWKIWHDNIGIIPEKENNYYYIKQYYQQVLFKLNPLDVYQKLDNSILLCYEENLEFCHRHIVAYWFYLELGIDVFEVKINDYIIEKLEKPEYIKSYLEKVMRDSNKIDNSDKLNSKKYIKLK